jgi:hypothetical protein
MNTENLDYLKDNVKYMGFGEQFNTALEENIAKGAATFQLSSKSEINGKRFEVDLNFKKSDSTDMYFFNSYRASLERANGERMEQTFYLNKGKGVTAKEAFNLLDGRSVYKELTNKEGQNYNAWLQLDPNTKDRSNNYEVKQFHDNYGFNLRNAVERFAISELTDPEKMKRLEQSLQKGNLQAVSFEKDGATSRMFIEANPQFKTLNVYDSEFKKVQQVSLAPYLSRQDETKEKHDVDQKKEVKQDQKQKATKNLSDPSLKKSVRSKKATS